MDSKFNHDWRDPSNMFSLFNGRLVASRVFNENYDRADVYDFLMRIYHEESMHPVSSTYTKDIRTVLEIFFFYDKAFPDPQKYPYHNLQEYWTEYKKSPSSPFDGPWRMFPGDWKDPIWRRVKNDTGSGSFEADFIEVKAPRDTPAPTDFTWRISDYGTALAYLFSLLELAPGPSFGGKEPTTPERALPALLIFTRMLHLLSQQNIVYTKGSWEGRKELLNSTPAMTCVVWPKRNAPEDKISHMVFGTSLPPAMTSDMKLEKAALKVFRKDQLNNCTDLPLLEPLRERLMMKQMEQEFKKAVFSDPTLLKSSIDKVMENVDVQKTLCMEIVRKGCGQEHPEVVCLPGIQTMHGQILEVLKSDPITDQQKQAFLLGITFFVSTSLNTVYKGYIQKTSPVQEWGSCAETVPFVHFSKVGKSRQASNPNESYKVTDQSEEITYLEGVSLGSRFAKNGRSLMDELKIEDFKEKTLVALNDGQTNRHLKFLALPCQNCTNLLRVLMVQVVSYDAYLDYVYKELEDQNGKKPIYEPEWYFQVSPRW